MENLDHPCKNKAHDAAAMSMPIADRTKRAGSIFEALAVMAVLQAVKGALELIAAPFLPDTRFAAKMLTMWVMLLLTAVVIGYAKIRRTGLSILPRKFSKPYIICAAVAVILMIAAPSNFTGGFRTILVLLYGSIVTPLYEELLFRGYIWNRLEPCFMGKNTTFILSAALFGAWHVGYMVPQLIAGNWFAVGTKAAVGFIYGLILGFVRLKSKNCFSTILLHGMMNLFAL